MKPQNILFEKMHGLGNDFVLIDKRQQNFEVNQHVIKKMANRHTGIGFDQLLLIDHAGDDHCDASYRFFNPDGSEAQQCGNGQRCLSYYLHSQNPNQTTFCLTGLAGDMHSEVLLDGRVRVNMSGIQSIQQTTIDQSECLHVLFGNPHLVTQLATVDDCDLSQLNHRLTSQFTDGINLEIVEKIDRQSIKIRVHERGTGETLACGSGACAAAYAMYHAGKVEPCITVNLPGGELMVEYDKNTDNIYLTGAATHVFSGKIRI